MKNGFTIIELMITVALVAIVMAMAVPSFTATIQNNRLASQSNTLLSALNYARSEAVKLGNTSISACGSSNLTACNSSNWESGWIIFRDVDADGVVDAGDTIMKVFEPLSGGNTLRTTGFANATNVLFGNRGMLNQTGSFVLCDSRGADEARAIVLNISGQARSASDDDATADGIVNVHTMGNATCP